MNTLTRAMTILSLSVAATVPTLLAAGPTLAIDNQVCGGLDTGKIDTPNGPGSVTVTAPSGKLVSGYCVKAGSAQNGNGPVYVTVNPPQPSVTFSYPGGKDISHYSASFVGVPVETTPTVPETTPTVPETTPTVPETTPTVPETTPTIPDTTPTVPETTPTTQVESQGPGVPTTQVESQGPVVPATNPATPSNPQMPPSTPGMLPETGSETTITFVVALLALGFGAGLIRITRRPRSI